MSNDPNKLLSDIVAFRTYAKFLPHQGRRESPEEIINRSMNMHLDRFPKLSKEITKAFNLVHQGKVLPSMRGMQFAGEAVTKNNIRLYNCSYIPIADVAAFSETLFLLLSGTGVGFSVQKQHISNLPKLRIPLDEGYFPVQDSIAGWAQALQTLCEAYFYGRVRPQFDFSFIREKGSYLVTTGARAPGPQPLRYMLGQVEGMLRAAVGRKLTSLEVHDIVCIIADCVLAGGIRRAALISLFDRSDEAMLKCKSGNWWDKAPWRARANNSAVLPRGEVGQEEFMYIYKACQDSGAGEPGFSWTNDPQYGWNPCHEISLKEYQFCNLTTVNQTGIVYKKDFLSRIYSATVIGTLQAAYTDFPYLSERWTKNTEEQALIGVSFTGIADNGSIPDEWLVEGANLAVDVNTKLARKIGTNPAWRVTTVKPEGSSSAFLGSASGIHDREGEFYLRRVRMNKDDALSNYLRNQIPELVEDDVTSATGVVVTVPQKSPPGAEIKKNNTALSLFERALRYNKNWVEAGHVQGPNYNNVSCTLNVREHEWEPLSQAMWEKRESYSGISLFPYSEPNYAQLPFEVCTQETYEKYAAYVKDVDLKQIREEVDLTDRAGVVACGGGSCEVV